jgi:hypothetical protein
MMEQVGFKAGRPSRPEISTIVFTIFRRRPSWQQAVRRNTVMDQHWIVYPFGHWPAPFLVCVYHALVLAARWIIDLRSTRARAMGLVVPLKRHVHAGRANHKTSTNSGERTTSVHGSHLLDSYFIVFLFLQGISRSPSSHSRDTTRGDHAI